MRLAAKVASVCVLAGIAACAGTGDADQELPGDIVEVAGSSDMVAIGTVRAVREGREVGTRRPGDPSNLISEVVVIDPVRVSTQDVEAIPIEVVTEGPDSVFDELVGDEVLVVVDELTKRTGPLVADDRDWAGVELYGLPDSIGVVSLSDGALDAPYAGESSWDLPDADTLDALYAKLTN